jgi:hypothetical protein
MGRRHSTCQFRLIALKWAQNLRSYARQPHLMIADAHDSPAPKPAIATCTPLLTSEMRILLMAAKIGTKCPILHAKQANSVLFVTMMGCPTASPKRSQLVSKLCEGQCVRGDSTLRDTRSSSPSPCLRLSAMLHGHFTSSMLCRDYTSCQRRPQCTPHPIHTLVRSHACTHSTPNGVSMEHPVHCFPEKQLVLPVLTPQFWHIVKGTGAVCLAVRRSIAGP